MARSDQLCVECYKFQQELAAFKWTIYSFEIPIPFGAALVHALATRIMKGLVQ